MTKLSHTVLNTHCAVSHILIEQQQTGFCFPGSINCSSSYYFSFSPLQMVSHSHLPTKGWSSSLDLHPPAKETEAVSQVLLWLMASISLGFAVVFCCWRSLGISRCPDRSAWLSSKLIGSRSCCSLTLQSGSLTVVLWGTLGPTSSVSFTGQEAVVILCLCTCSCLCSVKDSDPRINFMKWNEMKIHYKGRKTHQTS